jgi:hypothetical protein
MAETGAMAATEAAMAEAATAGAEVGAMAEVATAPALVRQADRNGDEMPQDVPTAESKTCTARGWLGP